MSVNKDGGQQQQKKRPGRAPSSRANSKPNSRSNSASNTPSVSPNKYSILLRHDDEDNEPWICEICSKMFSDPDSRLLECQRCKKHYCIVCLNKSDNEYFCLSKSDSMWFCVKCREIVEKNIAIDIKIEERCGQIMLNYESRISKLEDDMQDKCSEARVREIVHEEQMKGENGASSDNVGQAISAKQPETVETVLSEINERKARENNIVIHGVQEILTEDEDARKQHDRMKVNNILQTCKIQTNEENKILKLTRIGKFDKDKLKRPMLATFESIATKKQLFKNIRLLGANEELRNVSISNDLTRTEREQEAALRAEAKRLSDEASGDCQYRVRGPPWARKVVKIAKEK